ncbi:phospholipase [Candidatus Binatia bacterium]|nr:phospholipase [Candidatus Binatia bacterium]
MADRTLLVMPEDTGRPILDALASARKSILVKMFLFTDPDLVAATIDAHRRGVKVRVLLNAARRSGEDDNADSREKLLAAGVHVKDANPAFELTHEKSMVVDGATAFVMSLNWDPKNLTQTRDYAVTTSHGHEVDEVVACFEADWHRKPFAPGETAHLIWCNANGRERIARFIDGARESLHVQNERYQDEVIIERLVRARERGVKIHVMAKPAHTLKKGKLLEGVGGLRILQDVGVKVHKVKGLKLHAKTMLADGVRGIIGSINLAPGSFDHRRELAIEVHEDGVVDRLRHVLHHDWEHSHPLDLSDEGLLADLADREEEAEQQLAIEPARGHRKTK